MRRRNKNNIHNFYRFFLQIQRKRFTASSKKNPLQLAQIIHIIINIIIIIIIIMQLYLYL